MKLYHIALSVLLSFGGAGVALAEDSKVVKAPKEVLKRPINTSLKATAVVIVATNPAVVETHNGTQIGMEVSTGSGTYTTEGVITAWHVIYKAKDIEVYFQDGALHGKKWAFTAKRWFRVGPHADAGVIKLNEKPRGLKPAPIVSAEVDSKKPFKVKMWSFWGAAADLRLASYAEGWLMPKVKATWAIYQFRVRGIESLYWALTLMAIPGASGSGIFNEKGEVVGIFTNGPGRIGFTFGSKLYKQWIDKNDPLKQVKPRVK